ncbi:hypothetical protein CASFOL_018174 [Castilleja foliolosa]|uniref:Uncharacterized protein n=1 Tax=Castilleja foliolosa TaxID=1961234 RepID=A0ABD3D828_9LAMI
MEIARSSSVIFLSQRQYALNIFEDTRYSESKPVTLPMDPKLKISADDGETLSDPFQLRRLK